MTKNVMPPNACQEDESISAALPYAARKSNIFYGEADIRYHLAAPLAKDEKISAGL